MYSSKQPSEVFDSLSCAKQDNLYPVDSKVNSEAVQFNGRICIIGCGSISQCLQPLLLRHLQMDFSRITIIDMDADKYGEALKAGATFLHLEITRSNMDAVLGTLVGPGDIVVDLAWNISTVDMVEWCQEHGVGYLNTSVEVWDPYMPNSDVSAENDTIYARHLKLSELIDKVKQNNGNTGSTAIIEHGANPGLVSHWTKLGLEHIAQTMLSTQAMELERRIQLEDALDTGNFAKLSMLTNTKVIHISERDSQTTPLPVDYENEFISTWSVDSFHQESLAPAEMAWGTHERQLPADAIEHTSGPKNKIYLERKSMDTLAHSWVPSGPIIGQIGAHGEVFTISQKLTVREHGEVVYRPSIYFVYRPSDVSLACLQKQESKNYILPEQIRVMTDEIDSGRDEVGVLLLGHDLNAWWVGSTLDITETRKHLSGQNATTLQVAASALAALIYLIKHPNEGICTADDLPHKELLSTANPYLGECYSMRSTWCPGGTSSANDQKNSDGSNWTFQNFEYLNRAANYKRHILERIA